ncbi:unnamed protein product, partial [Scytosiphon promiscuus]
ELCDSVGPFDGYGVAFTSNQQLNLFNFFGANFLGIPRLGTHILRTYHVTMTCIQAIDGGFGVDCHEMQVVFHNARHSPKDGVSVYNEVSLSRRVA